MVLVSPGPKVLELGALNPSIQHLNQFLMMTMIGHLIFKVWLQVIAVLVIRIYEVMMIIAAAMDVALVWLKAPIF